MPQSVQPSAEASRSPGGVDVVDLAFGHGRGGTRRHPRPVGSSAALNRSAGGRLGSLGTSESAETIDEQATRREPSGACGLVLRRYCAPGSRRVTRVPWWNTRAASRAPAMNSASFRDTAQHTARHTATPRSSEERRPPTRSHAPGARRHRSLLGLRSHSSSRYAAASCKVSPTPAGGALRGSIDAL